MKTKNKLYAVTLLILLLSAVFVSAVSADTLEPWEEEFLEEYGEYWMYEDYGNQWFEYFLYEGNDEERYNELSLMYQNLAAQNAVPSNSVLEPYSVMNSPMSSVTSPISRSISRGVFTSVLLIPS